MKKELAILLAAVMLLMAFAGCGSSNPPAATTTAATTTAAQTTTAAAATEAAATATTAAATEAAATTTTTSAADATTEAAQTAAEASTTAATTTAAATSAATEPPTTAAAKASGPITITMPTYRSGEDVGAIYFLPAVDRFNTVYDGKYKVVIEESPSSTHNDKLKGLAQTGNLPPIFQFSDFTYARDNWFDDAYLYNLAGWLDANPDVKSVFVPAGIDFVTLPNGAIYAIPLAIVRPTGTYINNNVFTPGKPLRDMTWAELGAEMKAAGAAVGFQTLEGAWTVNLLTVAIMASQEGGADLLQKGLTDTITDLTAPQWVSTFTVLKQLWDDAGWKSGIGKAYPDTENAFVNNQIGVLPNGQWVIAAFSKGGGSESNWGEGFDGNVTGDIFPGNVAIANPCVYDWYVSGQCSQDELECALAFLAFISSPDELEAMMLAEGGSAPMITYTGGFLAKVAENKLMSDFSNAVNGDTVYIPYLHEILPGSIMDANGAFTTYLPLLFDGSISPKEFCDALTTAANE